MIHLSMRSANTGQGTPMCQSIKRIWENMRLKGPPDSRSSQSVTSHLNATNLVMSLSSTHTYTHGVMQDPLVPYPISGVLDPVTQGSTHVCALLLPQDLEQGLAHTRLSRTICRMNRSRAQGGSSQAPPTCPPLGSNQARGVGEKADVALRSSNPSRQRPARIRRPMTCVPDPLCDLIFVTSDLPSALGTKKMTEPGGQSLRV